MGLQALIWLRLAVLLLAPAMTGIIFYKAYLPDKIKSFGMMTVFILGRGLQKTRFAYFNYDRTALYLSRNGVDFMFEKKINPVMLLVIRIIGSLFFFALALKEGGRFWRLLAGAGGAAGFFLPDALIKVSNSSDNDQMMSDIKEIYDTLKIQTKAGVFLTYSLSECYLAVNNRRLKMALLELNNKILAKKDVETALDEFNMQFDNRYLDTFCIVLKQSLQSGQSVQILADLSVQMSDIQRGINLKEKEKLDRRIQILQLLIFVGLIGICLYGLGVEIMESLINF